MHKHLTAATLALLALLIALPAGAARKCGDNITWELTKYGKLTLSGSGPMSDFGYDDSPWLPDLVTAIEIEDGITHIGSNAFAKTKAMAVSLPSSVESVGKNAFKGCKYLASADLPYGLKSIGDGAFQNCQALAKITIPTSVRQIGNSAFSGCKTLAQLSVPSRVSEIGKDAFKGCKALTAIRELPDFITASNCAFFGLSAEAISKYENDSRQLASSAKVEAKSAEKPKETTAANAPAPAKKTQSVAYGSSDVDKKVPLRPQNNSNTFAIVIANENYARLASVPFAINDGTSFVTYCHSTLGLPETNISFYKDATYGNINEALAWLKEIDEVFDGDINVLFYYAGHGVPDEASNDAFIVPVDAAKPTRAVCYPLADLYGELGRLKAKNVKVFLDACFSGATRSNAMIAESRGIAIKPTVDKLAGNIVVLSATSDDQTAWQYDSEGHGLFTYFLLKKLQESQGDVTMGELSDYVTDNVRKISTVVNRKRQQPSVNVSSRLGSRWRSWSVR